MTICDECRHKGQTRYNGKDRGELDILVVGDAPGKVDCRRGHYTASQYLAVLDQIRRLKPSYTVGQEFALGCKPEDSVKAQDISHCSPRLHEIVSRTKPKALLLLGVNAARAFGINKNQLAIRGNIIELNVEGHPVKAVASYSAGTAYKEPGLASCIQADVKKAAAIVDGTINNLDYQLETPETFEEIMSALEKAREATRAGTMKKLVSVDTETTSLEPYRLEEKMIAISLSWKKGQGLAFYFDHHEHGLNKEKQDQVLSKLEEVLDPEYTVTCAANAKFDYKWLNYRYGLDIPFFDFDVMLLEHLLDEDKKNEYGLKNLTRDYIPELAGYDEELEKALADIQNKFDKEAKEKHEQALQDYFTKWQEKTDEQRKELLKDWVRQRYIDLPEIEGLEKIKTVQNGRKKAVSKAYTKSLFKVLKKLPPEILDIPGSVARKVNYGDLPREILLPYAAMDAMVTRVIFTEQYRKMEEDYTQIKRLEIAEKTTDLAKTLRFMTMPLAPKISEMEYQGIRIDREKLEDFIARVDAKIPELKDRIFSSIGRKINLSSSSGDLKRVLFKEKRYEPVKYTKTGDFSTDKNSMEVLYEKNEDEFIRDLLILRRVEKVRETYFINWRGEIEYDGRLHFSLNQHGTATYRLSANKGLQNAPAYLKEIDLNVKSLFLPDSEEYDIFDLDIANAELRVLCGYSKDETLIEAFNQGLDIHSLTAAKISDFTYEEIKAAKEDKTSEQHKLRQLGKKINFGTVYSMGATSLSKQLWAESRIKVSEDEAKQYLNKFFEEYPKVKEYMEKTRAFARAHRFVYTYTGRRRRFPMLGVDNHQKFKAFRQAINCRIQTTSADIVNTNLVDLDDAIKPLGGRVLLTVHDSILFQLPKDTAGVTELLDQVITENTKNKFPWLPVEWKYDVGKGPNYGECA
ncbi:DNA-directed DNA polymerase [Desulfonatronospira thiodismutans ASO3-1]|uniref:DNA polymerase I n=1 Tax=Desulfonatronospira thiodismutans ASO3-1 TaxID=555779 RepID=D6SLJ8_9BACT|nr:DNA polymerase [Desulfonatronospira thiodismutans]EFI35559.1 DNA-directed DNA polymerase [Desulfonatronospira thiodismutans ASO3-1]